MKTYVLRVFGELWIRLLKSKRAKTSPYFRLLNAKEHKTAINQTL